MQRPAIDESILGPLTDVMAERYPTFAEEIGMRLTFDSYDPRAFGNSILIYDGSSARLRISRDRGQIFSELSSAEEPDRWWPTNELLTLTNCGPEITSATLDENVRVLRGSIQQLVRALGPDFAEARKAEDVRKQAWLDTGQVRAELKQSRASKSLLSSLVRRLRS